MSNLIKHCQRLVNSNQVLSANLKFPCDFIFSKWIRLHNCVNSTLQYMYACVCHPSFLPKLVIYLSVNIPWILTPNLVSNI